VKNKAFQNRFAKICPCKYLSMLSWQFSPAQSNFTPESCRSLLLRSSSLREEFEDCRTEDTVSQHLQVSLQCANLNGRNEKQIITKTILIQTDVFMALYALGV